MNKQAIATIRRVMTAKGNPIDHLSDHDIEKGVCELSRGLVSFGSSMIEAARLITNIGRMVTGTR